MSGLSLCVDVSGGASGGAARFRSELLHYLDQNSSARPKLVGLGRSLTPTWLIKREILAGSSARLAVNNVSFVGPGRKTVLLRNALHFLRPEERARVGTLAAEMSWQTRVVHLACRRADLLVVPTDEMARRVESLLPSVARRIEVRAHPLTYQPQYHRLEGLPSSPFILFPSLPASHKNSPANLRRLTKALASMQRLEVVVVTADRSDLPSDIQEDPRVWPVGPQPPDTMPDWYEKCQAVYFPTTIESFGYPLAEARAAGRPVLAVASQQNEQVAGAALCGFDPESRSSLEDAIAVAMTQKLCPDPSPFDATVYFDWLLKRAAGG